MDKTKVEMVVTKGDEEGKKIAAMVREIGASELVLGLCDHSFLYNYNTSKEYEGKLNKVAGGKKAATIIKGALYLLSAGSSDFVQNYYVNPFVNELYTPD